MTTWGGPRGNTQRLHLCVPGSVGPCVRLDRSPIKVTVIGAHPGCNCWCNCPDPTGPLVLLMAIAHNNPWVHDDVWLQLHLTHGMRGSLFMMPLICFIIYHITSNILITHKFADLKHSVGHDWYLFLLARPTSICWVPSCHHHTKRRAVVCPDMSWPEKRSRTELLPSAQSGRHICWVPPSTPCFT